MTAGSDKFKAVCNHGVDGNCASGWLLPYLLRYLEPMGVLDGSARIANLRC